MRVDNVNGFSFTSKKPLSSKETKNLIRGNLTHPYYRPLPEAMNSKTTFSSILRALKNIFK